MSILEAAGLEHELGAGAGAPQCAHCHTVGDWKRSDKPEFAFASRMIKMTWPKREHSTRTLGGVTCWTCHRGSVKPAK